jgi:RNA-directed DNA polymerase
MKTTVARKSYPMSQCRLYKVTSPADLASRLGVSVKALEALAVNEGNYNIFPIEQKGKTRMVQAPKPPLQKLHARIHIFLSRIETPDYLHSAIKGRSYLSNAQAHLNEGNLIKVDVKKFFQSVPKIAVYKFFREHLRCAEHAAGLLANLLTIDGHLPTGSSSSPIISYYAFKDMFDGIDALATAHSSKMTCYVDDLAISGNRASPKLLYEVRQIIAQNGLKSHKVKYFTARRPKIVTGVVINKGQALLPNKRHLLIKQGYTALQDAATPEAKLDVLKGLTSRVHEAAQIDAASWLPKARALQLLRKELMKKVP